MLQERNCCFDPGDPTMALKSLPLLVISNATAEDELL